MSNDAPAFGETAPQSNEMAPWPSADALDPVLEVFKRDLDFSLIEKNLRLTVAGRAQQLANASRFLAKFRPLVEQQQS